MVDSNLVERDETAADQWISKNKEDLEKAKEKSEQKEKAEQEEKTTDHKDAVSETAEEPVKKNNSLPVILTVCALAAAAGIFLFMKKK